MNSMTGFENSLSPGEIKFISRLCQDIQALTLNEMIYFNTCLPYDSSRQLYLWFPVEQGQPISEQRIKEVGALAIQISQLSYNALYQLSRSMINMRNFGPVNYGIGVIPPPFPCPCECE